MNDAHITREQFEAYLLGLDLPDGLADAIEEHIQGCDSCARLGDEVDSMLDPIQ